MTSLRTSLPPSANECDEKVALRELVHVHARDVERLDAVFLHLVVVQDRVLADEDLGHAR